MSLLDKLKGLVDKDREQLAYFHVEPSHADRQSESEPLRAGVHYIRLRVASMYLRKETQWFTSWYPAVHTVVRLGFGDRTVELPNIADSARVGMQRQPGGSVIAHNFMLTPTVPFSGGVVSLNAGLLAVKGHNFLGNFLKTLGNFSALLSVPQLSLALNVAQPLAQGIQELFGAGETHMHLGLYDSFSEGELRAGYIVAVRAPQKQLSPDELWVIGDQLHRGKTLEEARAVPYEENDYVLFRIELFDNRDDWEGLTSIQEPYQEAIKALQNPDSAKQAPQHMRAALLRAAQSPDLTAVDKRRVVDRLIEQYREMEKLLSFSGATGREIPNLRQVMRAPMSVKAALGKGAPTVREIFGVMPDNV